MELWATFRVLVRRWYVVLPCLVLTALIAMRLADGVEPTYKAEGTVVFLRPLDSPDQSRPSDNPWQSVDYSLNQFALLMGQAAGGPAFEERVRAAGGSPTFSVTTSATQTQGAPTNQTPTLTLSVVANSPEEAMASYHILGTALDQEVEERQRAVGAPESTWIEAVDLTVPAGPEEQVGSRFTLMIVVGITGVLLTLGLVFLVDALLQARRHLRERDATGDPAGPTHPDGLTDPDAVDQEGLDRTGEQPTGGNGHDRRRSPVRLAPTTEDARAAADDDGLSLDDLIDASPDDEGGVDRAVGQ